MPAERYLLYMSNKRT